jgi:hypothetical protein
LRDPAAGRRESAGAAHAEVSTEPPRSRRNHRRDMHQSIVATRAPLNRHRCMTPMHA